MAFRFLTSRESHGESLTAVFDGVQGGLSLSEDHINEDFARRQRGYGRAIHRNHQACLGSLKAW